MKTTIDTDFACIKNMKGEYLNKWTKIKEACEDIFSKEIAYKEQAYTPHGAQHCNNIYNYISKMIRDNDFKNTITNIELFILNTAVLLHDIIMVYNPGKGRFEHSILVRNLLDDKIYGPNKNNLINELIEAGCSEEKAKQITDKSSAFWRSRNDVFEQSIDRNLKEYICDIIEAHSDVKKADNSIDRYTFIDICAKYKDNDDTTDIYGNKINVIQLAALLRLADELDITYTRAEGIDRHQYNINDESKEHWDILHLFKDIKFSDRFSITLVIDDNNLDRSGDQPNDREKILKKMTKIKKTIDLVNEYAFNQNSYISWSFNNVKLKTKDNILDRAANTKNPLDDGDNNVSKGKENTESSNDEEEKKTTVKVSSNDKSIKNLVSLIDSELSLEIERYIAQNELLKTGHYYIDENRVARDWIEVKDIMDNYSIKSNILKALTKKIDVLSYKKKVLFIGIDDIGMRLCSSLAASNYFPDITYLISKSNETFENYIPISIVENFKNKNYERIFLFVDVVVTGNTINEIVKLLNDKYQVDISLIDIYAVLYREQVLCDCRSKQQFQSLKRNIYAMNDTVSIQMCIKTNEECIYKKNSKDVYSNKRR